MTIGRRLALLCCGVWLACAPVSALAQRGTFDAMLSELSSLDASIGEASGEERRRMSARRQVLRLELAEAAPLDARAPTWLIDHSIDVLSSVEVEACSVRFGVPLPDERRRVSTAVDTVLKQLLLADRLARESVDVLEQRLLDAEESDVEAISEVVEPELVRLIDVEQSVRLPFYHGIAWSLRASIEGPMGRDAAERARSLLQGLELGAGVAEAERCVALGSCALVLRDGVGALSWFGGAGEAAGPGDLTVVRLSSLLGLAAAEVTSGGGRACDRVLGRLALIEGGGVPAYLSRLSAEGFAAQMLACGRSDAAWIDRAIGPLLGLESDPVARRKLAKLSGADWPWESLPARASFARAAVLLEGDGDGDGVDHRGEVTRLLTGLVERDDVGALLPLVLWDLGALKSQSDDVDDLIESVGLLERLASSFPDHASVADVEAAAAPLGRFVAERTQGTSRAGEGREAYLRALRLAAGGGRNDVGPELAGELMRLLVSYPELLPDSRARLSEVIGYAEALPSDHPALRELVGLCARAIQQVKAMSPRDPIDVGLASRAYALAEAQGSTFESYLRLILGEAELFAGNDESLRLLTRVVRDGASAGVALARARLLLGLAQRRFGNPVDAFGTLESLVRDLDGTYGGRERPPDFWMAWSEMLEMLREDNEGGDRTPTIRLHIKRLELLDASFGGEPYASRIKRVLEELGDT